MRKGEIRPGWVHGIALAICFAGWIGLTVYFDGIADTFEAARALAEAFLFTTLMGVVDLGVWACGR